MAKHTPDQVTTVALSHAEIYELLHASTSVFLEDPDLVSAKHKLRRAVATPKPVESSPAPVPTH